MHPGSMVPTGLRSGTNQCSQPHRTAPVGRSPNGQVPLPSPRSRYDRRVKAVVVGSGVMGAWTALWLRRRGHEVTLVDRFGPGNQLGSSGDESRITRSSHGADTHYPRWQRRALEQWRSLERASDTKLFEQSGVVWLASDAETFEASSLRVLDELGIPADRKSVV